ncbi:MAG: 16S rRNA (guanine(966)-N(2))-methyltransferase RsmD [Clostridia bacterium]|nr:16S rRNA (guanine(966)-N(2))-methyltransferase RsmD [Clostridia bacterium]
MRVISGRARGLKLLSLDGLDTRPTLDRVKEALFSMLTPYISQAVVLDLFAGSGALGIEALSRGSDEAVFVDMLPSAMDIVKKNVSLARFTEHSEFHQKNALDYLRQCNKTFDIIFLDPPYKGELYEKCLTAIYENTLLNKDGIIVLEWDSTLSRPPVPSQFEILKERRYGRVMVTLLSVE